MLGFHAPLDALALLSVPAGTPPLAEFGSVPLRHSGAIPTYRRNLGRIGLISIPSHGTKFRLHRKPTKVVMSGNKQAELDADARWSFGTEEA